ncbi:MAG: hypothetical protein AAFO96_28180, partial [Bacteroidota bacterium]
KRKDNKSRERAAKARLVVQQGYEQEITRNRDEWTKDEVQDQCEFYIHLQPQPELGVPHPECSSNINSTNPTDCR